MWGEKKEERRGKKEVERKEGRQRGEEERMVAGVGPEEPREDGSLDLRLSEVGRARRRRQPHPD